MTFLQLEYDIRDVIMVLIGRPKYLMPEWKFIERKFLCAKLSYKFRCTRIMPTILNFNVLNKWALLTYVILKGMLVDVGKVINTEIDARVDARSKK